MATWSFFSIKDFATELAKKIRSAVITVGSDDVHIPAHVLVDSDGNERSVLLTKPGSTAASVIVQAQTNSTGSNYSAFTSQACKSLTIINSDESAVHIELRNVTNTTPTLRIPTNGVVTVLCAANANEWEVRRYDQANVQVYVKGLAN